LLKAEVQMMQNVIWSWTKANMKPLLGRLVNKVSVFLAFG